MRRALEGWLGVFRHPHPFTVDATVDNLRYSSGTTLNVRVARSSIRALSNPLREVRTRLSSGPAHASGTPERPSIVPRTAPRARAVAVRVPAAHHGVSDGLFEVPAAVEERRCKQGGIVDGVDPVVVTVAFVKFVNRGFPVRCGGRGSSSTKPTASARRLSGGTTCKPFRTTSVTSLVVKAAAIIAATYISP